MANLKSAKKQAKQNIKRRKVNIARKTAIKTAIKKVLDAVQEGASEKAKEALCMAEAQLARAKSKGTIHAKTVSRRVSRLTKKVAAAAKSKK